MLRATRYLVATAGTRLMHTTSQCCDKVRHWKRRFPDATHASTGWLYRPGKHGTNVMKHSTSTIIHNQQICQGMPMATNLINAGHHLVVHDRTDAASRLAAQHSNVIVCAAPAEVASHSGITQPELLHQTLHNPYRSVGHHHDAPISSSRARRVHWVHWAACRTGGGHCTLTHRLFHHRPRHHPHGLLGAAAVIPCCDVPVAYRWHLLLLAHHCIPTRARWVMLLCLRLWMHPSPEACQAQLLQRSHSWCAQCCTCPLSFQAC